MQTPKCAESRNNPPGLALSLVLVLAVALGACATNDPNRRTKTGAAVGAVAGAVLGHQLDSGAGKFVGAAVGALAGGAVGRYMDNQQQAMEQALAEERNRHNLEIERLKDQSLKIRVPGEVSFDFDSAQIKPDFYATLDDIAGVLADFDSTVVHVIGHTDSIGAESYNADLSRRRAHSTGNYLISAGVSGNRVRTEGRGEREPRATNETAAGRQLNRRVEIVIRPIVEGQEQRAYEPPPAV